MMCIHIHFQEKKYFRKKTAEITRFDGTVNACNFDTLFAENIFFLQIL